MNQLADVQWEPGKQEEGSGVESGIMMNGVHVLKNLKHSENLSARRAGWQLKCCHMTQLPPCKHHSVSLASSPSVMANTIHHTCLVRQVPALLLDVSAATKEHFWMNQEWLVFGWGCTVDQKMATVHLTLCTIPPCNSNQFGLKRVDITGEWTIAQWKKWGGWGMWHAWERRESVQGFVGEVHGKETTWKTET
jgi:hypothetical protein